MIRTAPNAGITGTLALHSTVIARFHGTADAHGRFTVRVHVTLKPSKAVQALLTVRAQTGCGVATVVRQVTIEPREAPTAGLTREASEVSMTLDGMASGDRLTVQLQAAPHDHIVADIRVLENTVVVTGKGTHRARITRGIVLYHTTLHGIADPRGRFTGHARLTYRARLKAAAFVTVTAHTVNGPPIQSGWTTLQPSR